MFKLEAKDVLPSINRMQATERTEKCHFGRGDLYLRPWDSNSSERGTKHVFSVNLAQIRSAVTTIFHTQTKKSQTAPTTEPCAAHCMC